MSMIWEMIRRTELKIPQLPGTYETRVFVGGSYDLCMPELRNIVHYVKQSGFYPILAFDVENVPKDKIHDFDMALIQLCKYAIFEVSTGNGHMMEIEAAAKYLGSVVFTVYKVRSSRHKKPSPKISTMLTTLGVPMFPYNNDEKLRTIVRMIFPGIDDNPHSTWLRIIKESQLSPKFKSLFLATFEHSLNLEG